MEEDISVEELKRMLKELDKREKEAIAVVPQPRLQQPITITTTTVGEENEPSFVELAKKFEELANRLELVEKAVTKGFCYHVKLPFTKDEEYATVCQYHYTDGQTAKLLIDLLFKYYKHAAIALQAFDELDECGSYPPSYHVVMFTDPIRLAVRYNDALLSLTYVFKLVEGEYPEIVRVDVDVDNNKPRLRNICRVNDDNDIFAIKVNIMEALDMVPKDMEDEKPVHDPDDYWKYSLPED